MYVYVLMCACKYVGMYVRQFPKIIEYLVNGGVGPLLWEVFSQIHFFQEELDPPLYIHLSLGKAGPFTLESHIHVKALKMQGFSNN